MFAVVVGDTFGKVISVHQLGETPHPTMAAVHTDSVMNLVNTMQSLARNPPKSVLRLGRFVALTNSGGGQIVVIVLADAATPTSELETADTVCRCQLVLEFTQRAFSKALAEHLRVSEEAGELQHKATVHEIKQDGANDRVVLAQFTPTTALGESVTRTLQRVFTSASLSLEHHLARLCGVPGVMYAALVDLTSELVVQQCFGEVPSPRSRQRLESIFSSPDGILSGAVYTQGRSVAASIANQRKAPAGSDATHNMGVVECTDYEGRILRIGSRACRVMSTYYALVFGYSAAARSDPTTPFQFRFPCTQSTNVGTRAFGNYDALVEISKVADGMEKAFSDDTIAELCRAEGGSTTLLPNTKPVGEAGSALAERDDPGAGDVDADDAPSPGRNPLAPRRNNGTEIPHEKIDYVE